MKKIVGKCKLCGLEKELTFEHVPPKGAINDTPSKRYSQAEIIQRLNETEWKIGIDFSKTRWERNQQKGNGGYYLCEDCNNNVGSWYMDEYARTAKIFDEVIRAKQMQVNDKISVTLKDVHPLRLIKAIMVMFCDILPEGSISQGLRDYLLNRESRSFNVNEFGFFMYLAAPALHKENPLCLSVMNGGEILEFSEIVRYPIGVQMVHKMPAAYKPDGVLINQLAEYNYNESRNIRFEGIPYLNTESPFGNDFRSLFSKNNK